MQNFFYNWEKKTEDMVMVASSSGQSSHGLAIADVAISHILSIFSSLKKSFVISIADLAFWYEWESIWLYMVIISVDKLFLKYTMSKA